MYSGILLSHIKQQNDAICSNMDGPRDYHGPRDYQGKSDRERQISYDITYLWSLKNDTNEFINETEIDSQTQITNLWLPKGIVGEWRENKEIEINIFLDSLVAQMVKNLPAM